MSGSPIVQLGFPKRPIEVAELVHRLIRDAVPPKRVMGGFAYASAAGVSALSISGAGEDWREGTEMQWLVSIDQGRTEPAGLEALLSFPNSELRIFLPQRRLDLASLSALPRFHAKVLFAETGTPPEPKLLWTASANMTGAALGADSSNYEFGLALIKGNGLSAEHRSRFLGWWRKVWDAGLPATRGLISRYAALRTGFLQRNPGVLQFMEQPAPRAVKKAKFLWIETGAMSGGARNQIEFSRELAWFFMRPAQGQRLVDIVVDGKEVRGRPLTPKRTTFGVDIWRLGLPTGYDYAGKKVLFARLPSSGSNPRFELQIADPQGVTAKKWYERAGRLGTVSATHGTRQRPAREYGYY